MKFTKRKLIYLLLIIYVVFLLITLFPFFKSSSPIAGWDTLTHIYSNEKYPDNLIKGDYFFSDSYWFNGYSTYLFYPPLFFMSVSIINIISFNLLSVVFVYKLLSVILVFLFIYALYFLFNKFFEINKEDSLLFAIISSFLYLFTPHVFDSLGIGISSIFYLGEVTNFLGIVVGIFLITYSKIFFKLENRSLTNYFKFILLFSLLLLSHIFSFFFFSIFILILFIQNSIYKGWGLLKKDIFAGGIVIFGTILLCSFWLIPFLKNIGYSSAAEGTIYFYTLKEVFFALINNNFLFIILPILFLVGLWYLIKQKHIVFIIFWVFSFLFSVNLITLRVSVHAYRLFAFVYLLYLIMCVLGIYFLSQLKFKWKTFNTAILMGVILCLIYLFVINSIFVINDQHGFSSEYNYTLNNYPNYIELNNVILDVNKLSPTLVYGEQQKWLTTCYSSPHILEYSLAKNNVPSLLGLYTESSSSSRFVFYPLSEVSNNLRWLLPPILSSKSIVDLNIVFDRLALYNVDYILASSQKFNSYLDMSNQASLISSYKLCGENIINVYELYNPYKVVDGLSKKPIIIFALNDKDWFLISQLWYESDATYYHPLVRSKINFVDFNSKDLNRISGIIISEELYDSKMHNFKFIRKLNELSMSTKILIASKSKNGLGLKMFSDKNGIFNQSFRSIITSTDYNFVVSNVLITDNFISFDVDSNQVLPILIRKSYSNFWVAKNKSGKIDVYEYSPNFMLVYTTDKTELTFRIPVQYKCLLVFSLLMFLILLAYIFKMYLKLKINK